MSDVVSTPASPPTHEPWNRLWQPEDWAECVRKWGKCAWCFRAEAPERLVASLYHPLSLPKSPGYVPSNVVPACGACRERQGERHAREVFRKAEAVARVSYYLRRAAPFVPLPNPWGAFFVPEPRPRSRRRPAVAPTG